MPAEHDVIILDDEEESPVEMELRQKVADLEAQLERSRRRADNAFKEKLEVSREYDALKAKFEGPRMEQQDARRKELELARENIGLKKELEDTQRRERDLCNENYELKEDLAVARRKAEGAERANDLARENEELKRELAESRKTFSSIQEMIQQHNQGQRGSQSQLMQPGHKRCSSESAFSPPEKRDRFDDHRGERQRYPHQLQQHYSPHSMQQQQRMQPSQLTVQQSQQAAAIAQSPLTSPAVAAKAPPPPKGPAPDMSGGPTNLFAMCDAGSPDSMALDEAVGLVRKALEEHGKEHIKRRPDEKLRCEPCNFNYNKMSVIDHFLTPRHGDKVRGKAVSVAAVNYWVQQLQPAE